MSRGPGYVLRVAHFCLPVRRAKFAVPILRDELHALHTSSRFNADHQDLASLFEKRLPKDRRRKIYKRLNSLVKQELEVNFQKQNKTKLQMLDDKMNLKIKYDPRVDGHFSDFGIRKDLNDSLLAAFPYIKNPTGTQKKVLSVLNSKISCTVKDHPGQGKSLAALLYAINIRRPDPNSVTSVILVPSTELVKQFSLMSLHLVKSYSQDASKIIQFLFRSGDKAEEVRQSKQFHASIPHIVVTTPQRLLDLVSDNVDSPNHMKLDRLRFLCCDEADTLFGEVAKDKKRPAEVLIEYINRLRSTVVNNSPLQYCFINGVDMTNRLSLYIKGTQWCTERPIVDVGLSAIKNTEVVPRLKIPVNVNVSGIVVPSAHSDQQFYDIKLNELPLGIDAMKKVKSDVAKEFDANYRIYRSVQRRKLKPALPEELIGGIIRFTKTQVLHENGKCLIVVPEGISTPNLKNKLLEKGLSAISLQEWQEASEPEVHKHIISSVSGMTGVFIPNLREIICVGIDAITHSTQLAMLAGRCRVSTNGLIDVTNFAMYFDKHKQDCKEEFEDPNRAQITIMYPQSQFGLMERFSIERMILKCGLPHLKPIAGEYENIDLQNYEELFDGNEDIVSSENGEHEAE